jgi:CAAX protease family protein
MSGEPTPPLPLGESPAPETPGPPAALQLPARSRVAEDLDTPWDTLDLIVLFAFSLGMLYLLTNAMAAIAVLILGVPVNQITRFGTTNAGFIVVRQVIWFGSILLFLYAVIRRRTTAPFWRTIGWRGIRLGDSREGLLIPLMLLGGMLLAIGADIAAQFYNTEKILPIQALFSTRRGVEYVMAFGLLAAPLAEETVFRGYVYPVLARKFGILLGIVITGVLFGLVHVPQLWGGWGQIATLVTVGMVLTAARAATHSVFASYLVHLGYNSFLFAGFFIPPDALHHLQR